MSTGGLLTSHWVITFFDDLRILGILRARSRHTWSVGKLPLHHQREKEGLVVAASSCSSLTSLRYSPLCQFGDMKAQACEPCAKRKVRCDKAEPCSNCKRRKQDHCQYPELAPEDKIKQLEALVRSLGGDPDQKLALANTNGAVPNTTTPVASTPKDSPGAGIPTNDSRSKDPIIVEEDGQQQYLES